MANANEKLMALAFEGIEIEKQTLSKMDEIIEMYKKIRHYHFKRKRAYLSMYAHAKRGDIHGAVDAFNNRMPEALKYEL